MLQGQLHRGLQEAFFAPAIVALTAVLVSVNSLMRHEAGNGIGELDFATHAARLVANFFKNARGEHVAPGHAHARGGDLGGGFFNDFINAQQGPAGAFAPDNAVALGVLLRHFLHGQQRAALLFKGGRHLRHDTGAALLAHHQIVGQQHGEGFIAHQRLGTQHGVAQAQAARLAHEQAVHVLRGDAAHQFQQGGFAGSGQLAFQFVGGVKVVFNGAFAAARDKDHVADAGLVGFFDGVLDERFIDHGQHLFGRCLGGRQKAGAQASDGEYGFAHAGGVHGGCLFLVKKELLPL